MYINADNAYKVMAERLLFSHMTPEIFELTLRECKLQFRKGKSIENINGALVKTKKNGRNKVEFELDLLETYLKGVLKLKRPVIL